MISIKKVWFLNIYRVPYDPDKLFIEAELIITPLKNHQLEVDQLGSASGDNFFGYTVTMQITWVIVQLK